MNKQIQRQRAKEQQLTAAYVHSLLIYDPISGNLCWKANPSIGIMKNTLVSQKKENGYLNVKINGLTFRAHRVIWLMQTGSWPTGNIDHKDRIRSNNAWHNLRNGTQAQNTWNAVSKRGLLRGLTPVKDKPGQFKATIMRNGKTHRLGSFFCAEKAHLAYKQAVIDLSKGFSPYE